MTAPLSPVPGSAEVLAEHQESSQRYRLARTDRGFLVTSRTQGQAGMILAAEWLHRTEEAARALLDAVIAGDQATRALGTVAGQRALERFQAAAEKHKEAVARLGDEPLIGQDVREGRRTADLG